MSSAPVDAVEPDTSRPVLLEVRGLRKHFPVTGSRWGKRQRGAVKAVDGISLTLWRGEALGIVGESGCGKSTTGRLILGLESATAGEVIFHDRELGAINVQGAARGRLKSVRSRMQVVFQDPFTSLDPRMTVGRIIAEPLKIAGTMRGLRLEARVAELLTLVGLRPEHASRYPHAFSGGQRQRIGVARAIATNPDLIVCDEAVSALDVSVQAKVINLLEDLKERLGLSYLFISHDLSVVEHISDRVAVMYLGRVVEVGRTDDIFNRPRHPYTQALLGAVPVPDPRLRDVGSVLMGEVPSPVDPPSGCYFHTRCPHAKSICVEVSPELRQSGDGGDHQVACHFSEELILKGAARFSDPAAPANDSEHVRGLDVNPEEQ